MTLPVLKGMLMQNNELDITLVTRPSYAPFFDEVPGLTLYTCDFKRKYSGFRGIIRLFQELRSIGPFDFVVDLHSVLRTWILDFLFRLKGIPVSVIQKGRSEKKHLVQGKIFTPLLHTTERYLNVFKPLDLEFRYPKVPVFNIKNRYRKEAEAFIHRTDPEHEFRIGIAPFALHTLKTWPVSYTRELIQLLLRHPKVSLFFFGGGNEEIRQLSALSDEFNRCHIAAGQLSLGAEIALMQNMKFMITMDSSNMHISALSGVRTITIWGATHPYSGFDAYNQVDDHHIQIPKTELPCRPCTVFGKGSCRRKDFACMQWLTPHLVFEKLNQLNLLSEKTQ